jgi:L-lactate dehydrogenase complex protein LldG
MSARDQILKAIAANKPSLLSLPVLPMAPLDTERFVKIQKSRTVLEGIGGKVFETPDLGEAKTHLLKCKESGLSVACLYQPLGEGNISIKADQTAVELESIDTAFIAGSFGVAENGSVWLYESGIVNRLLPFICQHLVIILDAGAIVSEMHEAYRAIQVDKEGYGLFLAGPSKTADIEQSLVIGAHGARSTTVYLINTELK